MFVPKGNARPDSTRDGNRRLSGVNDLALIVPVRGFSSGKSRLAERLSGEQRARLARALAEVVVDPRHGVSIFVVCDDPDVADWAIGRGAEPVLVEARGLNESLTAARPAIESRSAAERFAIVHADLPLAHDLGVVLRTRVENAAPDAVVIASDGRYDGTNVLLLQRRVFTDWRFSYGPGSCATHIEQATSRGLRVEMLESDDLGLDLDTAHDLDDPRVRTFLDSVLPGWSTP